MTVYTSYITPETIASIRAKMKGYAVAAALLVDDWAPGAVSQQILEAVNQALYNVALSVSALVRGYASLDTSTDPGDPDPYDASNEALTAAPGNLSAKGLGDYGTPRQDSSYATGTFTLTNASGGAVTFAPGRVTFTRDSNFTGLTYPPTYRNSPDGAIYTNPDGTVTVSNGQTIAFPIKAEVAGTGSNVASSNHVSIVTVLAATGITGSNDGAIIGTDRQDAEDYRAACREAAALTSPNGPGDAYRYLAVTARSDGTYGGSTTGAALGVTRVYVSSASATGIVGVYLADPDGAPDSTAVDIISDLIVVDPRVVADPTAITITVLGATNLTIRMHYTVKMPASKVPGGATAGTYAAPWAAATVYAVGQKAQNDTAKIYIVTVAGTSAGSGGPTGTGSSITDGGVTWDYSAAATGANTANTRAVFTAIATQEADYLAGVDIGGVDQTAGAGVIYTQDLRDNIVQARINNVALGLYNPAVTIPAGPSTAVALGYVAVLGTVTGVITLV